ncbi:MAG: hypothetical protein Q8L41_06425 [Anaerolineales bacterium]|nr:hypothetical protein [Anaerolineales bacterium]
MSIQQIGYAFVNTPGIGGIVAISVITTAAVIYFFLTRWILYGNKEEEETSRDK